MLAFFARFAIAVTLFCTVFCPFSALAVQADSRILVEYFYQPNCEECQKISAALNAHRETCLRFFDYFQNSTSLQALNSYTMPMFRYFNYFPRFLGYDNYDTAFFSAASQLAQSALALSNDELNQKRCDRITAWELVNVNVNYNQKHWEKIDKFYLDNYDIDSDFNIEGQNSYVYLLEKFKELKIIPVVGIDRPNKHIDAVYQAKSDELIQAENIAIRFTPEDFCSFEIVIDEINEKLSKVISIFNRIDLILDCRICLDSNIKELSENIVNFVKSFCCHFPTNKIIITGSSIPASIRDLASIESEAKVNRKELVLFEKVNKQLKYDFNLFLGDYGIVTPEFTEIDIIPQAMQNIITAKIIYSFANQHYIVRGGTIKRKGYEQYFSLAKQIVSESFYRGEHYSTGDHYLKQKSECILPNAQPSRIIRPTMNAHITYMFKDYAID